MNSSDINKLLHKDRDELLTFVSKHERVFIFGAGKAAVYIKRYLDVEGIKLRGFVVSNKEKKETEGLPIYGLDEIDIDDGVAFIIGVREEIQADIEKYLTSRGVNKRQIYGQKIIFSNNKGLINLAGKLESEHDGDTFFSHLNELNECGIKNGTDKSSEGHNYLNKYELFFEKFKDMEVKILELGVLNGSSLRTWKDYFTNALIYGVDIDEECKKYETDRIKISISDLDITSELERLKSIKAHIIVDDASHTWMQQIMALAVLYPSIPRGGIYIMEDIETSFGAWKNKGCDDAMISGFDFSEAIAKVVCGRETLNPGSEIAAIYELKGVIYEIALDTSMISFIHGSCILVKS